MAANGRKLQRHTLPVDHPTAAAFLDESGSISQDRFFAVGCLKLTEPSDLTRELQTLRDRKHWYDEIHFVDLTLGALPFYKRVVDIALNVEGLFSCFVADRELADPIARYGSPWTAYEKLAQQLLIGSIKARELVSVVADNYSTPAGVSFEREVRAAVNGRLGRLAVTSICRMDSRAADPLQVVDLLTSAVTFEFRQAARLAGEASPKAQLAKYVRDSVGATSFLQGHKSAKISIKLHQGGTYSAPKSGASP